MEMAGPGGGPPRKSHTKSRKGCRTCKRRHIRCDEKFPQCRNCEKHNVRCDYMDVSKAGDEPAKGSNPPELLTSPQLQQALDTWRLTGESPLPELKKSDLTYWTRFSTIDLRLIHHITTLSSDLYARGYSQCIPWTSKMSNLIMVALSSDYTMNALLALSASHLAWQTKNLDTEHLAYHHRGIAIKGLHEALSTFSEHNSEAILAASILLIWQAKDWASWKSLHQGISTVMNAMRPWMHQSEIVKLLENQTSLARARSPSTPSLSGLPPQHSAAGDIERLNQIVNALHQLRLGLSSFRELIQYLDYILEYVEQIQHEYPLQGAARQFERLLDLRAVIFWLPTALLRPQESDLGALAMMAHFYTLALVLEPLFPESEGIHLGNMSLEPLEQTGQVIQARAAAVPHDTTLQTALSMLEIPSQISHSYRAIGRTVASPIAYRASPQQTSFSSSAYTLPSPHDQQRHGSYSGVSLQPPYPYAGNYHYDTYSQAPGRHDSTSNRVQSNPRISTGPSLHSMSSPESSTSDHHPTNIDYLGASSSYPATTAYSSIQDYHGQNRLVSTPSQQIWT